MEGEETFNDKIRQLSKEKLPTYDGKCFESELETQVSNLYHILHSQSNDLATLKHEFMEYKKRTENVKEIKTKTNNVQIQSSYLLEIFSTVRLPGINFGERRSELKLYKLFWIFVHIAGLLISTSYILDAYRSWQDSLIVKGQTYTSVKDIPFPAITICEPLLLKKDYNRFDILKRCISLENGTSWACSEEELIMLRISSDIYPLVFDLLSLNESERIVMIGLYKPIFEYTSRFLPIDLNRTFIGDDYIKYIHKLAGMERLSTVRVYTKDLYLGRRSLYRVLNSSVTSALFMVLPNIGLTGMLACHSINDFKHGPFLKKNINFSGNSIDHDLVKSSNCTPESLVEGGCNADLLYTDDYMEFEIEDAENYNPKFPQDNDPEMQNLHNKRNLFLGIYPLFFHNPMDHPSATNMEHFKLVKHSSPNVYLTPTLTKARKEISALDSNKRYCIFSFERKLMYFQFYTYHNCILECQINCSSALCGCTPHKTQIFNSSSNTCSNRISDICISNNNFFVWHGFEEAQCQCDCPFDCVYLSYNVNNYLKFNIDNYRYKMIELEGKTIVGVTFNKRVFASSIVYSLNSYAEFVAYSLGILGVFNGFTMMIVWKLFYRFTLGLWCTIIELFVRSNGEVVESRAGGISN